MSSTISTIMSFEMVWQFYCGISAEQKTLLDSEIVVTFQERIIEMNWLHEGESIFEQEASGGLGIEEVPSDADNLVPNLSDEERVAEGKSPLRHLILCFHHPQLLMLHQFLCQFLQLHQLVM